MKPRLNIVTLAVDDMDKAIKFYRGLGLQTDGVAEGMDHAAFHLEFGVSLVLYPRRLIEKILQIGRRPTNSAEVILSHPTETKAEVDEVLENAKRWGGVIVSPAADEHWGGYAGYFTDPDGHLWQAVWGPEVERVAQ
jgi:uncharacterized protein